MENHNDLFTWCLEQAAARYMGTLEQEKIDKLNAMEFPWEYYENELDKLGFHWAKNSPTGKDERTCHPECFNQNTDETGRGYCYYCTSRNQ